MRISDPKLVYFRMMQDAARLKDWADRMGNESHKAFATELERILVLKQALFTADTPAAKTKATPATPKALDAEANAIAKAKPVPEHIRAKYTPDHSPGRMAILYHLSIRGIMTILMRLKIFSLPTALNGLNGGKDTLQG